MAKSKTHRLTLEFTDESWKETEELQTKVNLPTKAELIRKSLRLYQYLLSQKEAGAKVLVRLKDSETDLLLVDF